MPIVKENLIAARELISDPDRWCQVEYAKTIAGVVTGPLDPDAVCFCTIGALVRATRSTVRDVEQDCGEGAISKVLEKACGSSVIRFNDTHSHAEVLAAFDRAIEAVE